MLGKLKAVERDGGFDLIVVDAPATGHAITLLTSPAGLASAARGGPVKRQAEEVAELLADPSRCRVLLVTLPRELAVDETIEAAYEVEDRAGVTLSDVVVNQYRPPRRRARRRRSTPRTRLARARHATVADRRRGRARRSSSRGERSRGRARSTGSSASLPLRLLALAPLDTSRHRARTRPTSSPTELLDGDRGAIGPGA